MKIIIVDSQKIIHVSKIKEKNIFNLIKINCVKLNFNKNFVGTKLILARCEICHKLFKVTSYVSSNTQF